VYFFDLDQIINPSTSLVVDGRIIVIKIILILIIFFLFTFLFNEIQMDNN
ncbi:uncharacterized protein METZ01_LOCUS130608, partial [marine metagenome]